MRPLLFLLALLTSTEVEAQDLYIRNARILDPAAKTEVAGNILIRGGLIAGFPSQKPASFTGSELDAGGRYVIPALTDVHTHSFGNAGAAGPPQFLGTAGVARVDLQSGVARFLDLFSPEDSILALRNRQRAGTVPGAEILAAGPCLTATRGHCSEYGVPTRLVNTPEEARREVTELAAKKPDVVKVVYDHEVYGGRSMPSIDKATLAAVVSTAREHGLKTVVHIGTWQDLRDAVEAGAAAVTHTPSGDVPADLPALVASRGTYHIPTLAVQGDWARYLGNPALLDSPLLASVASKAIVDGYRKAPSDTSRMGGWLAWQRRIGPGNLTAVGTLHRAGVPMLTGTDGGNPAIFQGYSVHRELALFVEAGLTPWEALAASTTIAGKFFGRTWGMTEGSEATLLV
ncbi:MAG TPA: amidohydrolase family protein, partial [Gemmatimonadales bacterium]|nr:amidohydrolase family protein [Gemmatimonadales bacterium]